MKIVDEKNYIYLDDNEKSLLISSIYLSIELLLQNEENTDKKTYFTQMLSLIDKLKKF